MWRCFVIRLRREVSCAGLLHACGGVSQLPYKFFRLLRSSPRMWRCFSSIRKSQRRCASSSPRMWRCFHNDRRHEGGDHVFSTHVEVFLTKDLLPAPRTSLLHACGGVSGAKARKKKSDSVFSTHVEVFPGWPRRSPPHCRSSPRMWRCFSMDAREISRPVFSTHVEVFLPKAPCCDSAAQEG